MSPRSESKVANRWKGSWLIRLETLLLIPLLVFSVHCSETGSPPPNILLVSIDTLRADRLGCYGYGAPTSPFLDELASRGVRFANAFVNTHGTTPSHASILSGLYQETHGVAYSQPGESGTLGGIGEGVPLLQEEFQRHGYSTIGVTGGGNVGRKFGFGRGFDVYDDRGGGVKKEARRLLEALGRAPEGRPVFAFFHTYEVHSPYRPPPKIRERFVDGKGNFETSSANLLAHSHEAWRLSPSELDYISDSYDGGIRYTDNRLKFLFEELESRGFFEDFLVVVTSDHGEEMGEHGGLLHREHLHDELLRVPLIIYGRGVEGGRVVDAQVSSVDIAPTLLAFAGIEVPRRLQGKDLLANDAEERPAFSQYGGRHFAIRTAEWKLIEHIESGSVELFNLGQDPEEQRNVVEENPRVLSELIRQLRQWKGSLAPRYDRGEEPALDQDEIDKLKALGYIG
jgi:arylsulfatase A-like enzyme